MCQILAATLRGSILTKVGRWLRAMIRDVLTWRGGEVTRHNTGIAWVGGWGGGTLGSGVIYKKLNYSKKVKLFDAENVLSLGIPFELNTF